MKLRKLLSTVVVVSAIAVTSSYASDMDKWLRPTEVPQPADNKLTPERIELGKLLYFDTRLSFSNKISCATCHHPDRGWTDLKPEAKSVGHEGAVGPRNSPTILNSAYQMHQFWDGRVRTLEQQALGPIEADVEMNMPLDILIPRLNKIEGYKKLFAKAYPDSGGEITKEYLAKAIASFERTAVSGDSRFDKFIKGDKKAITTFEKEGFKLFLNKAHCVDCHDGFNFTDGSFHNIGLNDEELDGKELGRYLVKRRAAWYGVFKTPTLRDVTKSYPYFHDGSVKTLEEATAICGNGGRYTKNVKNKSTFMIDRELTKEDIAKIVAFLETLEGDNAPVEIPTKFPQ